MIALQKNLGKEGTPRLLVPGGSLVTANMVVKRVLEHVILAPAAKARKVTADNNFGEKVN